MGTQRRKNRTKVKIRGKVEHPFRILKWVFGFVKVRFRGLKKKHLHLCAGSALVNLYTHLLHAPQTARPLRA